MAFAATVARIVGLFTCSRQNSIALSPPSAFTIFLLDMLESLSFN